MVHLQVKIKFINNLAVPGEHIAQCPQLQTILDSTPELIELAFRPENMCTLSKKFTTIRLENLSKSIFRMHDKSQKVFLASLQKSVTELENRDFSMVFGENFSGILHNLVRRT